MGEPDLADYLTLQQLLREYPGMFTESQLRWALRFRQENGLAEHVVLFGRRLYIHVPGFTQWFSQHREWE